jgi:hypothetical protein
VEVVGFTHAQVRLAQLAALGSRHDLIIKMLLLLLLYLHLARTDCLCHYCAAQNCPALPDKMQAHNLLQPVEELCTA